MGGKARGHWDTGEELQTSEVAIVLLAVPRHESEKQRLGSSSAALGPWSAAGRTGLCLLKAQAGSRAALLHCKNHLRQDVHHGRAAQLEPAGLGGGQHRQLAAVRVGQQRPG